MGLYNPSKIMDSLASLPTTVNAAYRRLLDRATDKDYVFKILSWIYHAKRPLAMYQLREAVTIELGDRTLNRNFPAPETLIQCCEGLVVWEQGDSQRHLDIVRLLHSTVRQFLDNEMPDKLLPLNYIPRIWFTYFNFDLEDFHEPYNFKFALFATSSWQLSISSWQLSIEGENEVDQELETALWTLLASPTKRGWISLNKDESSLHILAYYRMYSVYQSLLSAGEDDRLAFLENRIVGSARRNAAMLVAEMDKTSAKDSMGNTPLHYAAEQGSTEFMELLVSNGTDVEARNNSRRSALYCAALRGEWEAVKWLIEHGADVEAKEERGETVLELAVSADEWEVVKWLVGHGANPTGWVLEVAAMGGEVDVCKWLVEHGADFKEVNPTGWSVLHAAAYSREVDLFKWLVEHGADPEAKDSEGQTPLEILTRNFSNADLAELGLSRLEHISNE